MIQHFYKAFQLLLTKKLKLFDHHLMRPKLTQENKTSHTHLPLSLGCTIGLSSSMFGNSWRPGGGTCVRCKSGRDPMPWSPPSKAAFL